MAEYVGEGAAAEGRNVWVRRAGGIFIPPITASIGGGKHVGGRLGAGYRRVALKLEWDHMTRSQFSSMDIL